MDQSEDQQNKIIVNGDCFISKGNVFVTLFITLFFVLLILVSLFLLQMITQDSNLTYTQQLWNRLSKKDYFRPRAQLFEQSGGGIDPFSIFMDALQNGV